MIFLFCSFLGAYLFKVEVLEVQTANCGRDPFPKLLKKQKLRRNWLTEDANGRADEVTHTWCLKFCHVWDSFDCVGGIQDDQDAFYQWQDFAVGNTVNVYSRNLLVRVFSVKFSGFVF